jgi:hypothetical protein
MEGWGKAKDTPRNKEEEWSLKLMHSIVGSSSLKKKADEIRIEILDLNLSRRSDYELLQKVDKAITQANLLVSAAVQRGSHLTAIKLLLIVVDTLARIRWALGQKRMVKHTHKGDELIQWEKTKVLPDLSEWTSKTLHDLRDSKNKSRGKNVEIFCPLTKLKFAEKIRGELGKLMKTVSVFLKSISDDNAEAPILKFIDECIKSLKKYKFGNKIVKKDENGKHLPSLGELGHLCGSFISLPIEKRFFESGVEILTTNGRLVLNGHQRKTYSDSAFFTGLSSGIGNFVIESQGDFNPFVSPAGELRGQFQ